MLFSFFILCGNLSAHFYYQDGFSAKGLSELTTGTETTGGTIPALDGNWLQHLVHHQLGR